MKRVGHGVVLGDGDRQRTLQVLGVLIDLHLTAQAGSLLWGDGTICPLGKGHGSQIYGVCANFPNIFVLIIIISSIISSIISTVLVLLVLVFVEWLLKIEATCGKKIAKLRKHAICLL